MEKTTERSGVAAPRCAVCGGPGADGSGCEHCPAVDSRSATSGLCPRCGSRVALTAEGTIAGHKAPRARKWCLGGQSQPRKGSLQ